jgi:hypothetical protein
MTEERWEKMIETAASNFGERRTNRRCSFIASAQLVDLNSNSRLAARTADIDRGGCYIDTLNPLPAGTTVMLRVRRENQSFKANAEVVYVQTGIGMGLAFIAAEAEQVRTLDQWIAGLDAAIALNTSKPELPQSSERAITSYQSERPRRKFTNEREESISLMYLILMLVQKKVLSEIEGQTLLRKLDA